MPTQLQLRRGTTTEHSTFSGAVGEVTVDTTKDTLIVHDGATNGGFPLAKEAGATFGNTNVTGDFSFADNAKAIFGAGSDLQIYHTGTQSIISDVGSGNLNLEGESKIVLRSAGGSENYAQFFKDGAVELYYDNAVKLATTATGVDVTGTAVTDGLTVDGNIKLDGNYPVGTENVALGNAAFDAVTSGIQNTAIGSNSLTANTSGTNNTAVGRSSLATNISGSELTAVGTNALALNTGNYNTAVGSAALVSNTTASYNTAVGYQSLYTNISGERNTSLGYTAGKYSTGNYNVYIGSLAGESATGSGNVAIGDVALRNSTGSSNVAIGSDAMGNNVSGAINTATGYLALYQNSSGSGNSAYGANSLDANLTGIYNNAFGASALTKNQGGSYNCAFGYQALDANLNADTNTAVGHQAGASNVASAGNVYLGYRAGFYQNNANAGLGYNTLLGYASGLSLSSGYYNTFVGQGSGYNMTTGYKNVILGSFTGNQGGLDIRGGNNNIVLSDGDGNPKAVCAGAGGAWVFGGTTYQAANDAQYSEFQASSSSIQLGLTRKSTSTGTGYIGADGSNILRVFNSTFATLFQVDTSGNVTCTTGSYGTISDQRFKENIQDSGSQWDDIKAVQVKKYSMIEDGLNAPNQIGVIAQDLEASGMSGLVTTTDVPDVQGDNTTEMKTVKYSILYMKAVKALQEAMDRIETLEAKVAALEA